MSATVELSFGSDGVKTLISKVESIHDAQEAGNLIARTAVAIRLLHSVAKDSSVESEALPVGETSVFVCGCGQRLFSASDAINHVERTHTNAALRRNLDRLEDTIECLITPTPLSPWSNETLPVKSFGPDLIAEFAQLYADCDKPDFGNPVTKEHRNRAIALVEYLGWDKVKGLTYGDAKELIVLRENTSDKKIYKPMHEDFLAAFALLLRQVGGVLKD
jgi:hypothetical protein